MSLYLRLLKLQLNQRFGFSAIRAGFRDEPKKMIGKMAIFITAMIGILSIVVMYAWLLYQIIPSFQEAGLEGLVLGLALLVSMVLVFFMGLIYLIGMLFFAKDTEFLFSLPIPQRTVFASKFSMVLFGEIGTGAVMLLPAFVIFGILTKVEFMFWLRMIPVVLLAPCIPLGISGILALLLMRFNALWRRRDLLTIIGSLLLLVVMMAGQMYLQTSFQNGMTSGEMTSMLLDQSKLLTQIVSAFPPSGWAAEGLLHGGNQLLLFCGTSVFVLFIVLLLSNRLYQYGAIAQTETLRKNRTVHITGQTMKQKGVLHTLILREWRLIIRSPVYALNGLMVILMGPLMIILVFLTNGATQGDLAPFLDMFQNTIDTRITMLLIVALFMVIASLNTAVSTSISREGKLFYLLRVIPVSAEKQILAKFLLGFFVSVVVVILMAATFYLLIGMPIMLLLSAIVLGLIANIVPIALSMMADVIKPKLNWNSETEAIKQNMNAIIAMIVDWLYAAALIFGTYQLINAGLDLTLVIGIDVAFCVLAGCVALVVLCRLAKRSFIRIEG